MDLYAAICVVANVLNRLDVSASGLGNRASPICFGGAAGERFAQQIRVAALAVLVSRSAVVDEAGAP